MIIVRTPYRISFFGGGTDYPEWFNKYGGSVISTSIDKYSYITLKPITAIFNYKYRIRYYFREEVKKIDNIKHPVVRECLKQIKHKSGLDILHHGDIPARTGLGSSSCFSVGLIQALLSMNSIQISKRELAKKTINFEQNILKESVGSQDQIAASYGGFNKILFKSKNEFNVKKINIAPKKKELLNDWCQLIFTGIERSSQKITAKKINNIKKNNSNLFKMMEICNEANELLSSKYKKNFINSFADLLNKQWELKKNFEKTTTNKYIDNIFDKALKSGSIGGKILGAGGGGFLLLITDPKKQKSVADTLKLKQVKFKFESEGSKMIFKS